MFNNANEGSLQFAMQDYREDRYISTLTQDENQDYGKRFQPSSFDPV